MVAIDRRQGGTCSSSRLLGHLRRLLGMRQTTPYGAVLLKTGELYLVFWLPWHIDIQMLS